MFKRKGGGGKGFLNNVQKNCTFLTARLPLTDDVTLADKDTNSILTDNASREIQGNVAMQVMQTGGAVWWPNLKPIQVFHNGPTQLSLKWIQTQFVQQDNSS